MLVLVVVVVLVLVLVLVLAVLLRLFEMGLLSAHLCKQTSTPPPFPPCLSDSDPPGLDSIGLSTL